MRITVDGLVTLDGLIHLVESDPIYNIAPDYFYNFDNQPGEVGFERYSLFPIQGARTRFASPIAVQSGDTLEMKIDASKGQTDGAWFSGTNVELVFNTSGISVANGINLVSVNNRTGQAAIDFARTAFGRILDIVVQFTTSGTVERLGENNAGGNFMDRPIYDVKINTAASGNYAWPFSNSANGATQPEILQGGPAIILDVYFSSAWTKAPLPLNQDSNEISIYDRPLLVGGPNHTFTYNVAPPIASTGTAMASTSSFYYSNSSMPFDYTNGFTVAYSVIFNGFASSSGVRSAGVYSFANSFSQSRWSLLADNLDGGSTKIAFSILNPVLYRNTSEYATAVDAEVRALDPVQAGVPYHIVGVIRYATNSIELYVNGVSQGAVSYTPGLIETWSSTSPFLVGAPYLNGAWRPANSTIDNVKLIQRAFSTAEVEQLYTADQS